VTGATICNRAEGEAVPIPVFPATTEKEVLATEKVPPVAAKAPDTLAAPTTLTLAPGVRVITPAPEPKNRLRNYKYKR